MMRGAGNGGDKDDERPLPKRLSERRRTIKKRERSLARRINDQRNSDDDDNDGPRCVWVNSKMAAEQCQKEGVKRLGGQCLDHHYETIVKFKKALAQAKDELALMIDMLPEDDPQIATRKAKVEAMERALKNMEDRRAKTVLERKRQYESEVAEEQRDLLEKAGITRNDLVGSVSEDDNEDEDMAGGLSVMEILLQQAADDAAENNADDAADNNAAGNNADV